MNGQLFVILIILHLLSDFYIQTNGIAERKEKEFMGVLLHGLLYMISFGLYFTVGKFTVPLLLSYLALCLAHFMVDCLKYLYQKYIRKFVKQDSLLLKEGLIYLTDQGAHIVTIAVISFIALEVKPEAWTWVKPIGALFPMEGSQMIRWILLVLLIYKPMNITHGKLFSLYKPTAADEESSLTAALEEQTEELHIAEISIGNKKVMVELHTESTASERKAEREKKAGALIGFMERLIIVIFLYLQQYAAIGLVLTAKSIVRYDRISKEQEFSEYYLIGTLFSFISALVCYYLIIA